MIGDNDHITSHHITGHLQHSGIKVMWKARPSKMLVIIYMQNQYENALSHVICI